MNGERHSWRAALGFLLLSAGLAAGCLASPPSSAVEAEPDARPGDDAAQPGCGGLDRFIESFDEPDPMAVFEALWDPGVATYSLTGGALVMTADNGDALINSIAAWGMTGWLRVGPIELGAGAFATINLYGPDGTARLLIDDLILGLYQVDLYVEIDREPLDDFYAIGFEGDQIVFSASEDGLEWRSLQRWERQLTVPSRISISVRDVDGVTDLTIHGINTPETGASCLPE